MITIWKYDSNIDLRYYESLVPSAIPKLFDRQIDNGVFNVESYSLCPKLYDVLDISHILRNVINIVWKKDIMSCFTKLSLINNMGKINEKIERR